MLTIEFHSKFKRDRKKALARGLDDKLLKKVVLMLANEEKLPAKYHDHELINSRDYVNVRECHIQPDWLLVYSVDKGNLVLVLMRTGSHSDLFR